MSDWITVGPEEIKFQPLNSQTTGIFPWRKPSYTFDFGHASLYNMEEDEPDWEYDCE